jgi:hypothetical protein
MHESINQNDSNQSNTYQSINIAPDSPLARESISTDVGQSRRKDGSIDEQSRSPKTGLANSRGSWVECRGSWVKSRG